MFFFKQKTAYEMRISDWSSDVCSSDLVGLVLSLFFRIRAGWLIGAFVIVAGVAFVVAPQGRLWNARLLPFYYLSLYMLAAIGVAEVGRTLAVLAARDPERPSIVGPAVTAVGGMLACMGLVGMPLCTPPLGDPKPEPRYPGFFPPLAPAH